MQTYMYTYTHVYKFVYIKTYMYVYICACIIYEIQRTFRDQVRSTHADLEKAVDLLEQRARAQGSFFRPRGGAPGGMPTGI